METFGKLILVHPDGLEQEYELGKSKVTLGRAMTNDIILGDGRVSRVHARIECSQTGCTIVDLGSSNGTRLNGTRIEKAALRPGDAIQLGNSSLRFEAELLTPELDMTVIDTDFELEKTINREILPMTIKETNLPRLVVFTPEKTWELALDLIDSMTIGRTDENEIVLPSSKVSRRHAEIARVGDSFKLKDLGSTNGTLFENSRVDEMVLKDGDRFTIGEAQIIFKAGFSAAALTMADEAIEKQDKRSPVVFVPGLMGSELWAGSERVWPNVKFFFHNSEIFAYDESTPSPLEPRGIVDEVIIVPNLIKLDQYNRLGDYLVEDLGYQRGVDFFEFAYDWRQDVRRSARKLGEMIEGLDLNQPATIIAHSLGTLVTRYYVNRLGGERKVGRAMLMGGPHLGTPRALMGLLVAPNVLPFGLMGEKMRQLCLSFHTTYQILPIEAISVDSAGKKVNFLQEESWLPEAQRPLLRSAREFQKEIRGRLKVPAISIFGYGIKTITGLSMLWEGQGRFRNLIFHQEPLGDSSIPERSAVLTGSEIHPVQQYHGALFVDNDVKMRLKLELSRAGVQAQF